MADFTTFALEYNKTTSDTSPDWAGAAITFTPNSPSNELRWAPASSGAVGTTLYTAWPYVTRTASTFAVGELWAIVTEGTTGYQITPYAGATIGYNYVLRWKWDNVGTFAAAPQFTCFNTTGHVAPVNNGLTIEDGSTTDTGGNIGYMKFNAYGYGVSNAGTQQNPPTNGSGKPVVPTITDSGPAGAGGATSPGSGAWILTHWIDGRGWVNYLLDGQTPLANGGGPSTAYWYFQAVLFVGPNLALGSQITPQFTMQYSYV